MIMMETSGRVTWGNLGCRFKYTLQRNLTLVYNITMTKKNLLDSHHIKMVTVYASSSAALKPVYYDAARRLGEGFMGSRHLNMWSVVDEPEQVLEAIEDSHAWDQDALQFANVTPANA
jgi:predicted Rossmann-fold nucleotide-binding protein